MGFIIWYRFSVGLIKKDRRIFLLWVWNWFILWGFEFDIDLVEEVCRVVFSSFCIWGYVSFCSNGEWVIVF